MSSPYLWLRGDTIGVTRRGRDALPVPIPPPPGLAGKGVPALQWQEQAPAQRTRRLARMGMRALLGERAITTRSRTMRMESLSTGRRVRPTQAAGSPSARAMGESARQDRSAKQTRMRRALVLAFAARRAVGIIMSPLRWLPACCAVHGGMPACPLC